MDDEEQTRKMLELSQKILKDHRPEHPFHLMNSCIFVACHLAISMGLSDKALLTGVYSCFEYLKDNTPTETLQ